MQQKLDVAYDEVFIIDSLPDDEYENWQISQELMQLLAGKGIKSQTVRCRSRESLLVTFQYLVGCAASNVKFCLHLVSHGDDTGLWMRTTAEEVIWSELRQYFAEINKSMDDQLTVNMTSCFGLHGAKVVDENSPSLPFFGLIGYSDLLEVPRCKQINSLFYSKLIDGKPINIAVKEIRSELPDDKLYCISAAGYSAIRKAAGK